MIELVDYASELIDLSKIPSTGISRDDVISILSDVPCGLWEQVHDVMMEATKLQQEEFLSLKSSQNLLSGMEVSDEEKVRSLKNSFLSLSKKSTTFLLTVWNKMFSRQKINLEGLWRTCNATKEDVLNSLTHVRNLDKMIRILKDPKYSHIAYGINHKSGIEVAAMVKSFQSGQLDLTYLPPEIQSIIQAKHLH